ncbi:hypothetical protein LQL77_20070 [Rhodococcus cerastii]|nr:hypothetical protein [Rhodococcus cerastii]
MLDTKTVNDAVAEIVITSFGSELGRWLLDNNKIIPVTDDKTPACSSWKSWETFNFKHLKKHPAGLAVVVNERIQVLDVDNHDFVFGNPNVTTTKGAHYWFSGGTRTKTVNKAGLFDLKTTGYVVFYGIGKTFNHSNLASWDDLHNQLPDEISSSLLLPTIESSDQKKGSQEVVRRSVKKKCIGVSYTELVNETKVGDFKFELDKQKIMDGLETQIKRAEKGSRNTRLFRAAIEAQRLEMPTEGLASAAAVAGLDDKEIQNTLGSAEALFDAEAGISVLERARVWHDHASQYTKTEKQQAILDYIFYNAVLRNTYKPQINQEQLSQLAKINQGYISTTLNTVFASKHGLVERVKPKGKQPDGKDWPNNYFLCFAGARLEDMTEIVDLMVKEGGDEPDGETEV